MQLCHDYLVDGNRTFHGTRKGVNAMTPIVLDEEDLAYIKGFDLAISDCYSNLDPAEIQKINDLGVPFAYDFSEEFTEEILKEYCPHVDYCFLSCNQQGKEERFTSFFSGLQLRAEDRCRDPRRRRADCF